ncbi:tRNA 2-selenouridine(34) synthase MnmH [Algoriphagus hitonicola]|uniref:tRNA 2-selenouridine synthase n=1 Tax=Algoriphagus hitonicola TaxID=435880 RepID=A0A1I2VKC5_9BACT|nr:tRNA 2-selenouridine(34) synthase MnmH [Algoriphagus hitonicola]SFG87671.1 tRNA 2-selenouridine synthase [Algoriphagus hitonicola]
MNETLLSLNEFFELRKSLPILDARSEGEFAQSHIPKAVNLPILTNEERVIVGTLYKEKGNQEAILKGFELVGPRFHQIQKEALQKFPGKKLLIYCWRGGMRSQILSWVLGMVGFEVFRLKGGYKTYRSFTFEEVRKTRKMIILGGKTGTAKTVLLQKLGKNGEQIINLEGLANHKGSSFGAIGQAPQPSVEQFENLLAEELLQTNPEVPIWVENESRKIGRTILPDGFFEQMQQSPMLDIHKSEQERIQHIATEYGNLPKAELISAIKRLGKRLGGLRTQQAITDVEEGNNESWIANLLMYYDKTYDFDLKNHHKNQIIEMDFEGKSLANQVELLIETKKQCHE